MGTPKTSQARANATYDWAGVYIQHYVCENFSLDTPILDVGAGWGKYRDLLSEYPNMDACEVWEPYLVDERIDDKYRSLLFGNIHAYITSEEFDSYQEYDLMIFGDVFEHLTRTQARDIINVLHHRHTEILAVIPFRYLQGAVGGNPYEFHWQADLTPALMTTLYPELELLATEMRGNRPFKGIYKKVQK